MTIFDENLILETINMIKLQNFDIRTVTLTVSLRDCISEALKHNKIVFMHSYVEYPSSIALNKKFSIKTYDNIIKRLANETENVYYIDMHDCQGIEYSISDNIHYGRMFYDILYSRMMFILKDLVNS